MAHTAATAREAYQGFYGEVTDDEWGEVSKGTTEWDEFVAKHVKASVGDVADPPETSEGTQAQPETVTVAASVMAGMQGQIARLEEEKASALASAEAAEAARAATEAALQQDRVRTTVAATVFGNGTPTPGAVNVLSAALLDPTREKVQDIVDYLKASGGKIEVADFTEVAAAIAPPPIPASDPAEEFIRAQGLDEDVTAEILADAKARGVTGEQAVDDYLGRAFPK